MFISFDQITPGARLWVYQASRALTTAEASAIETAIRPALESWAAHGHPLLASAQVVNNRFLLLAVDEGAGLPSGCSIDSSVHTVQAIGQQLSRDGEPVDFMDRSATYLAADGSVQALPLPAIKAAVADGTLTPDTPVFNTLIKTKADYLSQWQVPAQSTWLKRYFFQTAVR
ncbi:hypothetical protein FAES_0223 [Fibrella aestuarina BUZ 2]|uniref:ABC transporter ATPase n=1 Tax=Fibrella aestuarina BUZ 2 TaxID=1166018 RepID=I0K284_9BACT|nr:hypothetical protein [Fibrella aestuarina]CCG98237.1 hypothetical protein FAES_0223 [Fibrella aestuarina BUZ 2]